MPENRVTLNDTQLNVVFNQATIKKNIVSGENISISMGKISKYLNDLGDAAFVDTDNTPIEGSTNTITSGAVYELKSVISYSIYN